MSSFLPFGCCPKGSDEMETTGTKTAEVFSGLMHPGVGGTVVAGGGVTMVTGGHVL